MNCRCGRRAEVNVFYRSGTIKVMCGVHASQAATKGAVIGLEMIKG